MSDKCQIYLQKLKLWLWLLVLVHRYVAINLILHEGINQRLDRGMALHNMDGTSHSSWLLNSPVTNWDYQ